MTCGNCKCDRCRIPEGAEVLARRTSECCHIYRDGDWVVKVYREVIKPETIIERAEVALKHPDLFAVLEYDEGTHSAKQRYIRGGSSTKEEIAAVDKQLRARGEHRVCDLTSPGNVIAGVIVDFALISIGAAMRRDTIKRRRKDIS